MICRGVYPTPIFLGPFLTFKFWIFGRKVASTICYVLMCCLPGNVILVRQASIYWSKLQATSDLPAILRFVFWSTIPSAREDYCKPRTRTITWIGIMRSFKCARYLINWHAANMHSFNVTYKLLASRDWRCKASAIYTRYKISKSLLCVYVYLI